MANFYYAPYKAPPPLPPAPLHRRRARKKFDRGMVYTVRMSDKLWKGRHGWAMDQIVGRRNQRIDGYSKFLDSMLHRRGYTKKS